MVYRIYVAKKSEFANEAKALMGEIKNLLKIEQIEDLKICYHSSNSTYITKSGNGTKVNLSLPPFLFP